MPISRVVQNKISSVILKQLWLIVRIFPANSLLLVEHTKTRAMPLGLVHYSNQHGLNVNLINGNVSTYISITTTVWAPVNQVGTLILLAIRYQLNAHTRGLRNSQAFSPFFQFLSGHLPGYLSAVGATKLHREETCTSETNVSACNAWYMPSPGCAAKEQHRTVSLSLACPCFSHLHGLIRDKMNCINCLGNQLCC